MKDKTLADALVDLLETGTEISSDDIFCSSLEGLGIPSGQDFITYIKSQIQHPEAVILLLSENYFASQFCLCELGAAWAMSHKAYPLLVPPLKYADVKGVLLSTQVDKIDNDSDLDRFYENLNGELALTSTNIARWGAKKRQFLKKLPDILSSLEKPTTVNLKDYESLKTEHDSSIALQDEYEDEISKLRALIKELEGCKDASEVKKIKREHLSGMSALSEELEAFKQAVRSLPPIVVYIMFRHYTGVPSKFNPWTEKQANQDAGSATEDGYLKFDDGFELNLDDPKVKRASSALCKLDRYIDGKVSDEVLLEFEEESQYQLSLSNRRLWKDHFCDQISRYFA
ncbi:TIR domain-containing protein [Noviherbaspirillum sp. 17J57-3]|uniref:TIR domain-containing protein n=1 Tax=Noviherbaspirillum galbum TaxID=2709383 RepID=A0A6B3SZ34_9BURK|nr:TIR domain-containing protein [Noviherbaspirillum galbum]